MGTVWRATDLQLQRVVAVKQLRVASASTPQESQRARQRVFREARAAARLQHPHAVTVYDVATDDQGQPVLIMEYVPAQSLAATLDRHGTLPPAQVAHIGAQLAAALAAAHAAGIVHRDIKPANVLFATDDEVVKLTDFGLARTSGDVTVTGTGLLAGTPAFLAPETARGAPPSPAADVFSLGATLYTAVEGTPPFGTAVNPVAQLHRVAKGNVPPPRQAGPLTQPLLAMLRDDPATRPTMSDIADTLAAITDDPDVTQPVTAARSPTRLDLRPLTETWTPPPSPQPPKPPRHRAGLAVLALVAASVLTIAAVAALVGDSGDDALPASTPTTRSTTPPADPALLKQSVTHYYAQLADDPERAWELLGPAMRDQDPERFDKQWADTEDLRLLSATVSGNSVVAEIEYSTDSRNHIRETHRHTMLVDNGTALINSDELLSSRVVDGTGKNKGKNEKTNDKEQKKNEKDNGGEN